TLHVSHPIGSPSSTNCRHDSKACCHLDLYRPRGRPRGRPNRVAGLGPETLRRPAGARPWTPPSAADSRGGEDYDEAGVGGGPTRAARVLVETPGAKPGEAREARRAYREDGAAGRLHPAAAQLRQRGRRPHRRLPPRPGRPAAEGAAAGRGCLPSDYAENPEGARRPGPEEPGPCAGAALGEARL